MESSRSNIENHQKIVWSSSDELEIGEVRLYKCTFCGRGFSNAQALGGHMNIHRRDRARMKELDIPSSTDIHSTHQLPSPDYGNFLQSGSSDRHRDQEKNCTHKRPLIHVKADDQESRRRTAGIKEMMQHPLFLERSSPSNDSRSQQHPFFLERSSPSNDSRSPIIVDRDVERTVQRTSSFELDLELRLGPEPRV
ncbi:hypothetical protein AgCh_035866 [Apium graveolens]